MKLWHRMSKHGVNSEENKPVLLSSIWSILGDPTTAKGEVEVPRGEVSPVPEAIQTRWGVEPYPGMWRMEFASIPAVDSNGRIHRVQIRKLYLDKLLNTAPVNLNLQPLDFMRSIAERKRAVIVAAAIAPEPLVGWRDKSNPCAIDYLMGPNGSMLLPKAIEHEYAICHWETVIDAEAIATINNFEALIEHCIVNNLDKLPSSVLESYKVNFLKPVIGKVVSRLKDRGDPSPVLSDIAKTNKSPYFVNVSYSPEELKDINSRIQ